MIPRASILLGMFLAVSPASLPGAEASPGTPSGTPSPAGGSAPYVVPGEPIPGGMPVGLEGYLAVSALTFGLGIAIIVIRRNAIAILMGIELLLNAAGLNFVAFSKFVTRDIVDGQVVTIFLIVIAAGEAAVALAIILNIFNNLNTVAVDEADELKG